MSVHALEPETAPDVGQFGRIATFTWPELSHGQLDAVRKAANIRTAYPRIGPEAAFALAVKEFDGTTEGGRKFFARLIGTRTAEFVSEVVVPQTGGEVKGERENLVRARITPAGVVEFDAYFEAGLSFIAHLGDHVIDRVAHHRTHTSAGLVSEWAERVAIREFGGLPLENRGHSVHVRGPGVAGFDAFVLAMRSFSFGQERVQIFKTVDTDPASIASLVASVRSIVEEAVEVGEKRAAGSKTARGINAAVDGLVATRAQIEAYRDLLGAELDKFVETLDRAAGAVSGAEVVQAFGGLV